MDKPGDSVSESKVRTQPENRLLFKNLTRKGYPYTSGKDNPVPIQSDC